MKQRWLGAALLLAGACAESPAEAPLDAGTPALDGTVLSEDGGMAEPDATPGDQGTVTTPYTWWQDVQPIVSVRCQTCHSAPPQFGAPRSFVSYADTQVEVQGAPAHQVMSYRLVAPQNRMPPSSQPQLSAEERAIIMNWSAGGAPEGVPPGDAGVIDRPDSGVVEPTDAGTPPERNISRSFEVKAHAPSSTDPYEMPVDQTNYVCFSFTIPSNVPAGEHAFRFEHLIDNSAHTHHTLLFVNTSRNSPDGEPFSCGGFPLDWNMVAGWAPGRTAEEIPTGAGVPLQAGDQLVLQVHYDRVTAPGGTDQSGVRVLMTDEADLSPAGMVWSGVIWQSALNGNSVSKTNTCTLNTDFTMFSVFPHMHKTGTRITLEVQRGGSGPWTSLVDISGWSFEDQPNIGIPVAEQQIRSGDKLRTTCWWNTMGQSVNFGEASDDEMCFNFVYHYPVVNFQYACVGYQF